MTSAMSMMEINSLLDMARDHSEAGRRRLIEQLGEKFLPDHVSLSDRELALLNDIVAGLVAQSDVSMKCDLSAIIAPSTKIQRQMLMMLATDRIEVARPVLAKSKVLHDDDLLSIIQKNGGDHAKAVAQRETISQAVVDALIVTGDVEIMTLVAKNLGAQVSDQALHMMTDAARFAEQLRAPIAARPELKPEQATKLYWWLSADVRRQMLARLGLTHAMADETLQQTIEEMLAHYQLQRNDDGAMQQIADWMLEREAINPKTMTQVLRLGFFRLFNILLCRLTALPQRAVDALVAEAGGRSLAAVCKAMGADKPCFVSIFLLSRGSRSGEQIVHPRELSQAIGAYDRVSATVAQQLLQTWRRDPSYLLRAAEQAATET